MFGYVVENGERQKPTGAPKPKSFLLLFYILYVCVSISVYKLPKFLDESVTRKDPDSMSFFSLCFSPQTVNLDENGSSVHVLVFCFYCRLFNSNIRFKKHQSVPISLFLTSLTGRFLFRTLMTSKNQQYEFRI